MTIAVAESGHEEQFKRTVAPIHRLIENSALLVNNRGAGSKPRAQFTFVALAKLDLSHRRSDKLIKIGGGRELLGGHNRPRRHHYAALHWDRHFESPSRG
ncbi:hypothetical protein [Variovorax sp. tm]|uniref:hypothetical protein n=1 Tax=Variovorax atrisoli TaxID=3394203 RepID=UPI003A800C47